MNHSQIKGAAGRQSLAELKYDGMFISGSVGVLMRMYSKNESASEGLNSGSWLVRFDSPSPGKDIDNDRPPATGESYTYRIHRQNNTERAESCFIYELATWARLSHTKLSMQKKLSYIYSNKTPEMSSLLSLFPLQTKRKLIKYTLVKKTVLNYFHAEPRYNRWLQTLL